MLTHSLDLCYHCLKRKATKLINLLLLLLYFIIIIIIIIIFIIIIIIIVIIIIIISSINKRVFKKFLWVDKVTIFKK